MTSQHPADPTVAATLLQPRAPPSHGHHRSCRLFHLDGSMRSTQVAISANGAILKVEGEEDPQEIIASEGCKCAVLVPCSHFLPAASVVEDKCNVQC